ncbi:hypothetical protein D3C71_1444800 [compost metagenome]
MRPWEEISGSPGPDWPEQTTSALFLRPDNSIGPIGGYGRNTGKAFQKQGYLSNRSGYYK